MSDRNLLNIEFLIGDIEGKNLITDIWNLKDRIDHNFNALNLTINYSIGFKFTELQGI